MKVMVMFIVWLVAGHKILADPANERMITELMQQVENLQQQNAALRKQCTEPSITVPLSDDDIPAIQVDDQERLTMRSGTQYSTIRCVGPGSPLAIKSRQQHPHSGIDDDDLTAGDETNYYGGCKQRVCLITNACLTTRSANIIVHLDPSVPDAGASVLKAEADDALGHRFFRLDTHHDGQTPADALDARQDAGAGAGGEG
jgi:hypothetical protein